MRSSNNDGLIDYSQAGTDFRSAYDTLVVVFSQDRARDRNSMDEYAAYCGRRTTDAFRGNGSKVLRRPVAQDEARA